jgi:hypothetical protein
MITVTDGLGRIWKETVMASSKLLLQHWPNGTEKGVKTSIKIANFYLKKKKKTTPWL